MPAEAYTLPRLEERHIRSYGVHHAGYFMAGNARICDAGKNAKLGDRIAVTDAAGLDADAYLSGTRLGKLFLH
jgi:hypothetical protein